MASDLEVLLRRGGEARIDLLQFAVYSAQPEPLFMFLASEMRLRPSIDRALALYDVFCATRASFRLRMMGALAAEDARLARATQPYRSHLAMLAQRAQRASIDAAGDAGLDATPVDAAPFAVPSVPSVSVGLFDPIVAGVRESAEWHAIGTAYDSEAGLSGNLPGGMMTAAQRQFVTNVWQPMIRPRLVAADFQQARTLGG